MFKPPGIKNYGSIGHLPQSRLGSGDHKVPDGQARICIEKTRDKHDRIIVTEKLDGSNCGVALLNGEILALGRAGHLAQTSKYEQHQLFAYWVREHTLLFRKLLAEGERCVGEWLAQAHGTVYDLVTEPFFIFDIMRGNQRAPWDEVVARCRSIINTVPVIADSQKAFAIKDAMHCLDYIDVHSGTGKPRAYGYMCASEPVEGAVWRVERKEQFEFMAKYVRPDKVDGKYLPEVSGKDAIWNWRPSDKSSDLAV